MKQFTYTENSLIYGIEPHQTQGKNRFCPQIARVLSCEEAGTCISKINHFHVFSFRSNGFRNMFVSKLLLKDMSAYICLHTSSLNEQIIQIQKNGLSQLKE